MGQAFSSAKVAFCRSDIISDVYHHLGGWDYDRICTAWASFFTSAEERTLADGTPAVFVADLAKFQRVTGLSKKAAQQLGQVFKVRNHVENVSLQRIARFPGGPWRASGRGGQQIRQGGSVFPMFEILVVIVVLGNLKRVTKLSLLFSLFSLNGVLSEAEFFLICYFVFRGMAMAVKRPVPGYGMIESLVLATFDELTQKQCSADTGCLRSSSTASTGSTATAASTSDDVPSKRNSKLQDLLRSSCGHPSGPKKYCSMSEIEVALARLQKMQDEREVPQTQASSCCRREMTLKDFLCLTLGPGSALDLIFRGLHGDCPLAIAAHLDFTRSLQFQTRLFQNVFLVQQWLQNPSSDPTGQNVVRLAALLSVCIDLAEKAAEITREIYGVIAADRRMALQGMACVELPVGSAREEKLPKPHDTKASQSTAADANAQHDTSPGATQQQGASEPRPPSPSTSGKTKNKTPAPPMQRRLPASVLTSLLAEQHIRRQLRYWWPDLRVETTLDSLPDRSRVFRKLMDVFSSRLYGNLVCGSSVVRCRITHTESLRVRSIIHGGGREPWIEAAVTQGLDTGRGPPVRVIAEADTKRVLAEEGTDKLTDEFTMELPDVRDNYYLVFTVKSWASDNEIVTVGRGAVLLSTFAEEKTWTHTSVAVDPAHSPAAGFTCEDPYVGCSLLLETQKLKDAIDCNPQRLNALNFYIRDVMSVEQCALYLHFDNGHSTGAGVTRGNQRDMNTVALSIGVAYRGKPVAGIIFFPFAESESVVGLTDYGCLKPSFWKHVNETYVKLPAKPRCAARRISGSFRGTKGNSETELRDSTGTDAKPAKQPAEPTPFQNRANGGSVGLDKRDAGGNTPREPQHKTLDAPLQRGTRREARPRQSTQFSMDSSQVYSFISRSSTGFGTRDSTSRARRHSLESVCRSGLQPVFPSSRSKIDAEMQSSRNICTLPTGVVTVPLRLLCPRELFETAPAIAERTLLGVSTEEERAALHSIVKDPRACSIVSCGSAVSAKTALVGTCLLCARLTS